MTFHIQKVNYFKLILQFNEILMCSGAVDFCQSVTSVDVLGLIQMLQAKGGKIKTTPNPVKAQTLPV